MNAQENLLQHHQDEGISYGVGPRTKGWRLDEFLHERLPRLSKERLEEAICTRVRLSWGAPARPETVVQVGGQVLMGFWHLQESEENPDIPVLFEDEHFLAVDKPAGMLVHPTGYARKNTLKRILERKLQRRLYMVHRLDRDTSGAILFTKRKPASQELSAAFRRREVEKQYLALVEGAVLVAEGLLEKPLGKMFYTPEGIKRHQVADPGQGESAVTGFRLEWADFQRSLLRVFPQTGRTHQIRVHLAGMGHPIVGDKLYGTPGDRLCLHSSLIGFKHPESQAPLRIVSPTPREFARNAS